jgi:uncharacterized protein DUF5677
VAGQAAALGSISGQEAIAAYTEQLLDDVEMLVSMVEQLLSVFEAVTLEAAYDNPRIVVCRAVLRRQVDGLRAAILLTRAQLGHLALPYVRPACEEFLWLSYLVTLEKDVCASLLLDLACLEGAGIVLRQERYGGSKEMERLVFSPRLVRVAENLLSSSRKQLEAIAVQLGWPARAMQGVPPMPSTRWIASQVKQDKLYVFLYSASSKGVHF